MSDSSCPVSKSVIYCAHGKLKPGGLPSFHGGANPPDERKEGLPMYVTYSELIQIGIFIVALVGLCHQIFKSNSKRK